MLRTTAAAAVVCLAVSAIPSPARAADRWDEFAEVAVKLEAVEPTPRGDSHIGVVESGKFVQLRFPAPGEEAAGYWLSLGNIVGYSGKGSSYQLLLRRDSEHGPLLYRGPVIVNGDEWNRTNRPPIDITDKLTAADRERGYVDVFVTGVVKDDGWTLYRHSAGRPILARAAVLTPEMQERLKAAKAMAERGASIIPAPRKIEFHPGEMTLTPDSRILQPGGASGPLRAAAEELRDLARERTGVELRIAASAEGGPRPGDVVLKLAEPRRPAPEGRDGLGREGYVLTVAADSAEIAAAGEAGCFYGAMSFAQMLRRGERGAVLPACRVEDRPAFPYRIIQYDVARGQTVNVEYVKRIIRELARCKINALLFYMEDDFRFRKYPFLGREGTFTQEKARELSEYAKRRHMQLIPQFESLGHAGAVLRHEELKDLREAGGAWVFCTSTPRTWELLDDVFGELVEAFPYTDFIHTGGDEFETGFGKCDKCRAKVERDGIGALYAEHMNKLNRLVKKRGKTMMFWPSHAGPTPELSYMTVKYEKWLEKDCIPTEWIYHGPPAYPSIEQYQRLGFKDVHCCPAVVSYSAVWPNNRTTFRGIRGFYQWGEDKGCGGAYCTTWEFMYGALLENSMMSWLPSVSAMPTS